jgi:hypothetical protein
MTYVAIYFQTDNAAEEGNKAVTCIVQHKSTFGFIRWVCCFDRQRRKPTKGLLGCQLLINSHRRAAPAPTLVILTLIIKLAHRL